MASPPNSPWADSGDPTSAELEALFSGPPLSDQENPALEEGKGLKKPTPQMEELLASILSPQELAQIERPKERGPSLTKRLQAMAQGASHQAANRQRDLELERSLLEKLPPQPTPEPLPKSEPKEESPRPDLKELDPRSPEALRERIRLYQQGEARQPGALQAVGVVFSFGFSIAMVILFFWWLGGQVEAASGSRGLFYLCVALGIVVGLYSGFLVLRPYLIQAKRAEDKKKAQGEPKGRS